jgi:hypothetical protein
MSKKPGRAPDAHREIEGRATKGKLCVTPYETK